MRVKKRRAKFFLRKREWFAFCLLFFVLTLFVGNCLFNRFGYTLHRNIGNSLSHYISYGKPINEIKRGMYVNFDHHLSFCKITKKVKGIPGDRIKVSCGHVLVDGVDVGLLQPTTRYGDKLHPIAEGVVPEGYLFVSGSHPESFDSRYAEFGLVPIEKIEEEICPIF